ncbi:MAG: DUF58 domain-containing protein [Lachnospiraceae bacterium]|nr:DUF58 domain-containing protein [Lachnospiraceae bacterium]
MRRNRIILLILWIASLFAISFYGGTVSYGIFVFLTLIPVVAIIYILLVRAFFRIYQEIDGRDLKANSPSVFYFTLQNESPIAFSGVRVLFYSSFSTISDLSDRTEYGLFPHDGIKKHTRIVCRYRGEYEVGIKSIVITDFLRLFSIPYNNKEPFTVTVKPDIIHLTALKGVTDLASTADSPFAEKNEPDVLSRQYVPGDDVRLINWKVSAASGGLLVRAETGTGQRGIGIIMDPKRYGSKKEDYLAPENRMLEVLIALALYFCKKNVPVNVFHTPVRHEKSVVDMKSFDAFYQRISDYSFKEENDPAVLFEQEQRRGEIFEMKSVFFILRKWDEKAADFAAKLSQRNIPVTVYLVGGDRGTVLLSPFERRVSDVSTDLKKETTGPSPCLPCLPCLPEHICTIHIPTDAPLSEVM